MGAGIGFLLGAGMRYYGDKVRAQHQQKMEEQRTKTDMESQYSDWLLKNPQELTKPGNQAWMEKRLGPEATKNLSQTGQMVQQFQQQLTETSAPSSTGPSPSTQMMSTAGGGVPGTSIVGPGDRTVSSTPAMMTGAPAPSAGTAGPTTGADPRIAYLDRLIESKRAIVPPNEAARKIKDDYIARLEDQRKQWVGESQFERRPEMAGAETAAREQAKLAPDIIAGQEAKAGRLAKAVFEATGGPERLAMERQRLQKEAADETGPLVQKVMSMWPGIDAKNAQAIVKSRIGPFTDEQAGLRGAILQTKQVQRFMDKAGLKGTDVGRSYYRKFAPQKLLNKDEQTLTNYLSALEAVTVPVYLKRTRLGQTALEWFRQHVPHIDDTHDLMRTKTNQLVGFLSLLERVKDPFLTEAEFSQLGTYMDANPDPSSIERAPATGTQAAAQPAATPTPEPLPAGVPSGSVHGTSKTRGAGWKTPDGRFIPDS